MNYSQAIKYNQEQANSIGWEPDWFIPGHKLFDASLVDAIKAWQQSIGIEADGLCGPGTYRRKYTERMLDTDEVKAEAQEKSNSALIFA